MTGLKTEYHWLALQNDASVHMLLCVSRIYIAAGQAEIDKNRSKIMGGCGQRIRVSKRESMRKLYEDLVDRCPCQVQKDDSSGTIHASIVRYL